MFGIGKKHRPSIPAVRFDRTRVTEAVKADLWTTVQEYEDLPMGAERAIYEAALEGISRGRDLGFITKAMTVRGMPQRRAGEIAYHLTNRAMGLIDTDRMATLGITEAQWLWSGVCGVEGHKAANGKMYDSQSGAKIGGRTTVPGREPGCSCVGNPVVPGFD